MRAADERHQSGHDIIHMECGQPGTPAPSAAREAIQAAVAGIGSSIRRRSAFRVALADRSPLPRRLTASTSARAGGGHRRCSQPPSCWRSWRCFDEGAASRSPSRATLATQYVKALGLNAGGVAVGPAERWMPSRRCSRPQAAGDAHRPVCFSPAGQSDRT